MLFLQTGADNPPSSYLKIESTQCIVNGTGKPKPPGTGVTVIKRASMDYINHINYKRHLDWNTFLNWSKKNNFRLILLTTKSDNIYYNYNFKNNDILIFGRESAGVPKKVHNIVDKKITIPMVKDLRSINVSSAVALVIGEACRQLNLF